MDLSIGGVPTDVTQDSTGNDSSSSDAFVPLADLLGRPLGEDKQSCESLIFSSCTKSAKDRNDECLIKMKTESAPTTKPEKEDSTSARSVGTNDNKADVNIDESSDNEPLIKIAKVHLKAAEKPFSVSPKKSVNTKNKESLEGDDSSDDVPLSELAKKLEHEHERKVPVTPSEAATPNIKSKRNAARKQVKYAVYSSDSSDNEPLAKTKRKLTKTLKEQKTPANSKKKTPKHKDKSLKDSSSDDDDVPLVNLIAKKKPVKKDTKTSAVLHGSASRKGRGLSDDSSEDEPLINLVKNNHTDKKQKNKSKASVLKKRVTTPKKPRKKPQSGSNSDDDDDDDDDVPLVSLIVKKKPVKKNRKTTAASRKRQGISDDSSEDEPLINLVKKNHMDKQMKTKTKASGQKKRDRTPRKPRKKPQSESTSNSPDDETLVKTGKHPQVTKILRITLERCDSCRTEATGSLSKTCPDTLIAEKILNEESEGSEEPPEEE